MRNLEQNWIFSRISFLAITLGTDTVNINWVNDLPPFQSKFEPTTPGAKNRCNDALISLKRISRPPSYDSVLEWCGSISIAKAPMAEKSKENDAHDSAGNFKNFRLFPIWFVIIAMYDPGSFEINNDLYLISIIMINASICSPFWRA